MNTRVLLVIAVGLAFVVLAGALYSAQPNVAPTPHFEALAWQGAILPGRAAVSHGAIIRVEVHYEDESVQVIYPGDGMATATPVATDTPSSTPTPAATVIATWTPTATLTPPTTNTPRPTATAYVQPSPTPETVVLPTLTATTPPKTCSLRATVTLRVRSGAGTEYGQVDNWWTGDEKTFTAFQYDASEMYLWGQHDSGWSAVFWQQDASGVYQGAWLIAGGEGAAVCRDVTGWPWNLYPPEPIARDIGGYHVLMGASQTFLYHLDGVGWVKALTNSEHLALQAKQINPDIVIIDRSLLIGGYMRDAPVRDEWDHPEIYYPLVRQGWTAGFDYYEFKNEIDHSDPAKEADFNIAMLELMGNDGYCGLAMSSGPGHPPMEYWDELIRLLRWIDANPCGHWPDGTVKYHGLALHQTGVMPAWVLRNPLSYIYNTWITGRHVIISEYLEAKYGYSLRKDSPGEHFRGVIVITEMGFQDYVIPNTVFTCEEVRGGWEATINSYKATNIIDGFNLWNIGSGNHWVDLTGCLPMPVVG